MNKKIINRYIKRGYASIGKWMGLLLLPLLLFSSCVDDSVTNGSTTSSDSTQVRLTFNLQQQTSLTRSLSSTGTSESQVDNINVLIFDGNNNNSKLIGSTYQTYGTSQTSSFSVTVPTRVASGCTIYAVANLPSDSLKNVATVSDFNKKFILMSSAATLGNGSNMTMFGQTSSVTISATASSNTPSITLTRLGSKLTFNITPATGITITGYQLCHVPMASYITSATDSTYFNAKGTYGNFDAVSNLSSTTTISPTFYTYENLVGRKSGATSYFSRSASNSPTDATYLLIYAQQRDSCWHAIYRIYLGGSGTNDYANYNIYRNYNCTYNIHIDGADAADVRVTYLVPKAGDYYYSDGNWSDGTVAPISGKTVIGIVFSTRISSQEQAKGYTHGYVIALTDANSGNSTTWGSYGTDTSLPNYTTCAGFYSDLSSGYVGTYTNSMASNSTSYPAFYYAKNYSVTAPSNSSGWYLPSAGQWWDLIANLGGVNLSSYQSSSDYYFAISTTALSTINGHITAASGTGLGSVFYWSASEYTSIQAVYTAFASTSIYQSNNGKGDAGYLVRATLAF
jgi:hypothetical protein